MRILITNNTLAGRAGSELYVRDLALALLRRGHNPVAYSTIQGEVAEELRLATIPVVDDLNALTVPPDVIHGQHHLDAMVAMLRFPDTPAVLVCHGWLPWEETPYPFPSIHRYVAVDDLCRERLFSTAGVPAERVQVIYNFVDLDRFTCRAALPERPESALVFSNNTARGETFETIRAACAAFGIRRVDILGAASGTATPAPEQLLGNYDVVFAKARCALEALAVGCAVVVADYDGLGGMVTSRNVTSLRALNFGVRTLQHAKTSFQSVMDSLGNYDPMDAARVRDWIRSDASMDSAVDQWQLLYEEAIQARKEMRGNAIDEREWARSHMRCASDYLRALGPRLKIMHELCLRTANAESELAHLRTAKAEAELEQFHRPKRQAPLRRFERFIRHLRKRLLKRPPAPVA